MINNLYVSLNPFKRIPYWLFWLLLNWFLYFSSAYLLGYFYGTDHFRYIRISVAIISPFFPIAIVWFHINFRKIMQGLVGIIGSDNFDFAKWSLFQEQRIFTFRSLSSKLFTGFVLIITVTTILISNINFTSISHKILFTIWCIPILFFCSHGAYFLFALMGSLHDIVRKPAQLPFFMLPHPSISNLQNYFSNGAVVVTVFYIWIVVAFYEAYQISVISVFWVSILGLYPLSMFLWSVSQVHTMMKSIKENQYNKISVEVDNALMASLSDKDVKNLERLEKLMEIQKKVQSMPEYPINFQGMLTFLITFSTAAVQTIISILSL